MSKEPRAIIAEAIARELENSTDTTHVASSVAAYLVSEGRESDLDSIMRDVMRIRRQNGTLEVDVQTTHDQDAAVLTELVEMIQGEFPNANQLVVDTTRHPELIGGVRITTADEQLDLSVRGKLDTFKRLTHGGAI